MSVLIDNRQKRKKVAVQPLRKIATVILNALDCPKGELSILIVNDSEIAELNGQYLNRSGPTNVIAFPMQEGAFSDITPNLLGDVVISMDTTEAEAELGAVSVEERFIELLVHGVLHLFGYDHETEDADARRMEEKSQMLMDIIHSAGPTGNLIK
jgi:probable rRNA maturation factor